MEGMGSSGGGCCIARYTHPNHNPNSSNTTTSSTTTSNSYFPYYEDLSKMDRIMLRFRPIAPKPTTFSTNPTSPNRSNDDLKGNVSKKKRKSTSNNSSTTTSSNKPTTNKRRKSRSPDHDQRSYGVESCHVDVVTLPLIPETPDLSPRENDNHVGVVGCTISKPVLPTWLRFRPSDHQEVVVPAPSTVIVEGVSDTWVDKIGLGRSDEERRKMLDGDTCPAFISDGWNRVLWTNEAYRRMVTGEQDTWRKVVVRLEMREKVELPPGELYYSGFTCRVRVQYGNHTMMTAVPCDVWRMDGGGFAWRLDVKAALCLGL